MLVVLGVPAVLKVLVKVLVVLVPKVLVPTVLAVLVPAVLLRRWHPWHEHPGHL